VVALRASIWLSHPQGDVFDHREINIAKMIPMTAETLVDMLHLRNAIAAKQASQLCIGTMRKSPGPNPHQSRRHLRFGLIFLLQQLFVSIQEPGARSRAARTQGESIESDGSWTTPGMAHMLLVCSRHSVYFTNENSIQMYS
jgi:hypothetical protein